MKMTNEKRQALIAHAKRNVEALKAACNCKHFDTCREDLEVDLKLAEIALAALTAEPAAQTESDDYCNLKELYHAQEKRLFKLAQRIKGPAFDKYAHTTAQAIDVLEASLIDNTAQQYEALAGWKMVPVEPTDEMLAAYYDKSIATISRLSVIGYRAMLEAAPKPEDKC